MSAKELKTASKSCRFSESEYRQLQKNASKQNMSVSALIRERALISPEEIQHEKDMIERNAKCEMFNHILSMNLPKTTIERISKELTL